jgi:hypothetical protein
MQKCAARTRYLEERWGSRCSIPEEDANVWSKKRLLDERGCKGVEQETASWKKGVTADVTPLEGVAKVWCKKRLLDEEDAKVWSKKRLLGRKV